MKRTLALLLCLLFVPFGPLAANSATQVVSVQVTKFKSPKSAKCTLAPEDFSFTYSVVDLQAVEYPELTIDCKSYGVFKFADYGSMLTSVSATSKKLSIDLGAMQFAKVSGSVSWPEKLASDCAPKTPELQFQIRNSNYTLKSVTPLVSESASKSTYVAQGFLGKFFSANVASSECLLENDTTLPKKLAKGKKVVLDLTSHAGKMLLDFNLSPEQKAAGCLVSTSEDDETFSDDTYWLYEDNSSDLLRYVEFDLSCDRSFESSRVLSQKVRFVAVEGQTRTIKVDFAPSKVVVSGKARFAFDECLPADTTGRLVFLSAEGTKKYQAEASMDASGNYSVSLPTGRYTASLETPDSQDGRVLAAKCAFNVPTFWVGSVDQVQNFGSTVGGVQIGTGTDTDCSVIEINGFPGSQFFTPQAALTLAVEIDCQGWTTFRNLPVRFTSGQVAQAQVTVGNHKLVQVSGVMTVPAAIKLSGAGAIKLSVAPDLSGKVDKPTAGWISPEAPTVAQVRQINASTYQYSFTVPEGDYDLSVSATTKAGSACVPGEVFFTGIGNPLGKYNRTKVLIRSGFGNATVTGPELQLQPGGKISGYTTRSKLKNFVVVVLNSPTEILPLNQGGLGSASSDAKGKFVASNCVAPGDYYVVASPNLYTREGNGVWVRTTSGTTSALTSTLEMGYLPVDFSARQNLSIGSITGRVYSSANQPVEFGRVYASCSDGTAYQSITTSSGDFTLEGISYPNDCKLLVQAYINRSNTYAYLANAADLASSPSVAVLNLLEPTDIGQVTLTMIPQTSMDAIARVENLWAPANEAMATTSTQIDSLAKQGFLTRLYSVNQSSEAQKSSGYFPMFDYQSEWYDVYQFPQGKLGQSVSAPTYRGKAWQNSSSMLPLTQSMEFVPGVNQFLLQNESTDETYLVTFVIGDQAPIQFESPSISGLANLNKTISLNPGVTIQNPYSPPSYQWFVCSTESKLSATSLPSSCTSISGEVSSNLVVKSAYRGKYLLASVAYSNNLGSQVSYTPTTSKVK